MARPNSPAIPDINTFTLVVEVSAYAHEFEVSVGVVRNAPFAVECGLLKIFDVFYRRLTNGFRGFMGGIATDSEEFSKFEKCQAVFTVVFKKFCFPGLSVLSRPPPVPHDALETRSVRVGPACTYQRGQSL